MYLGVIRVLPGVANLASNYDRSYLFSFRDMIFFVFFQKSFQKTNLILFSKFEIPSPVVVAVRGTPGVANLASKYDCSNPCSVRDMTFFVIFSKNFRKS